MIPKIIHYCWFGGKPLPRDVKQCIKSWKKMCPDYEIRRWDESNVDILAHPFLKSAYEQKAWAFVSDYVRLKVVYENGGIYLDTDVELLKNLDMLRKYKMYIGVQQVGKLCNTGLGFGAERENIYIKEMLSQYDDILYSEHNKKNIACPYLNDKVIRNMGYKYQNTKTEINGVLILPPKYLDPIAPGTGMEVLKCEDTISIHHYSASWTGKRNVIKRKIIRMVGQEKIRKIKEIVYKGKKS